MLDIKIIREEPDRVKSALSSRGYTGDLDEVLRLDEARREIISDVENLKSERNAASKEIGRLKKAGEDIGPKQTAMREVGDRIAELDARLRESEAALNEALLGIPNLPHPDAPVGLDDSQNRMVRSWGEAPEFAFDPKSHVELGQELGLFDFERAARMTGAGFPLFTGMGARLERALIQFMIDLHVAEHGFTEISPPFLCNAAAMTGTGQLPKMAEDMYHLTEDDLYLVPTAEVPVTNMFREEIITDPLPINLVAYTPCFRREAGAAGKDTRGLIRVHQFDKVEMVKIVSPASSCDELESLVEYAEAVLRRLGLPYRVRELCTGDLSFAAAKCYDIELWAAGQKDWLEVSSCSNFVDFQARRARIRFRNEQGKPEFVHTLNGSGVALPRLFVALLENGQQADGSVALPEAIRPYLGGLERITPPA